MAPHQPTAAALPTPGFARVFAPALEPERPPLRRAPHAAALALLAAAWFGGLFEGAETALRDFRFQAAARPASGELVLVEADPGQATPARLAAALDRLLAGGARQVALLDPPPAANPAFAAALARAGERVVLARPGAPGVRRLAGAELPADADGRLRAAPIWTESDGKMILNLPAALLGVRVAGAPAAPLLDFAIAAESVPRLALADALTGDAAALAGRDVLLVQRHAGEAPALTPQGPLPTADAFALAYETLAQGRWLVRPGALATLAPAAALALVLGPWFARVSWRSGLLLLLGWQAACLGLSVVAQARWAISLDVLPWLAAPALSWGWESAARLRRRQPAVAASAG